MNGDNSVLEGIIIGEFISRGIGILFFILFYCGGNFFVVCIEKSVIDKLEDLWLVMFIGKDGYWDRIILIVICKFNK